jgi:hypothetical protein
MRFEARELKPYGEPVPPEELREGEVYFGVLFLDQGGIVPVLEPRVFIGRNLEPTDSNEFYFQDFASYMRGVRYASDSDDGGAIFETGAENHIFEYERALDRLMECALRRDKLLNPSNSSGTDKRSA